jgi:phosphoribosyl 1,2-cyclic phosphate phosphodiesterase
MSDFVITFLGTGTSVGVPMIGCDCETCTSTDPRDQRYRSSVHIATPEASWIVDTGPELRLQCLRENIRDIDAVVYTHAHMDHVTGFDDLRRFSSGRDAVIDIYATAECLGDLKRMFAFAFDGTNRFPGYIKPEPHVIDRPFRLGETELVPLPVAHGRVETIGFLFMRDGRKVAAYLPDCKTASVAAVEALRGVDCLIVDALRLSEHPTHMNIAEACEFSAEVEAGETWLTHIAHEVLHAREDSTLPSGIRIAYDRLKLER